MEHEHLIVGAFYWVWPVLEPEMDWQNDIQPARYAGNDKWNYLGQEGESDWPVRWVGPQLTSSDVVAHVGPEGQLMLAAIFAEWSKTHPDEAKQYRPLTG